MPLSIREFTDRLEQVDRVEVLPVDVATWIKNWSFAFCLLPGHA